MVFKFTRTKALKLLYKSYLDFYNSYDSRLIMSFRDFITHFRKKKDFELQRRLFLLYFLKGRNFFINNYCKKINYK